MSELAEQQCAPCRGDEPPLDRDQIDDLMSYLDDGWKLIERNGSPRLRRTFRFKGFQPALDFTMEVGHIAEEQGHHPRIVTQWGSVTVDWWTHKIDGLHNNDFVMASRTDKLALVQGGS